MTRLRLLACAAGAALLLGQPSLAQTAGQPLAVEIPSHDQAEIGVFGFDLNGMDTTVRPGADFNRYANGTWLANTPIPADRSSYGQFDVLADRSEANLRAIIEESAANPSRSPEAARIGALYGSFMDEVAIERLGVSPLAADLSEVRAADTHEKMAALMGRTHAGFGVSLFSANIFEDLRTPGRSSAYIAQGGLGMPNREYYLQESFASQRAAYRTYIERALTLAGWTEPAASADAILAFETRIAQEHWNPVEARQLDKIYNPMTVAQLTTDASGFDWAGWAEASSVGDVETFVAMHNTALPGMARVYAETPIETLKAWQAFHIIHQAAPYLSQAFVDARFDFVGRALSGQEEQRPRWKRGVALVDDRLGEALGREYVTRHFPAAAKAQMEDLVANLRAAMTRRIENLDWMSDETKRQALYKMSRFGVKIGYPEKWRSYDGLELVPGDLYGNVERSIAFGWAYDVARLDRPIDPLEWGMTPQTVNAYYNPIRNEIVFPAAILQAPFFDPRADPAINYGGIGAVIGHEITHGFDDQGRKTDGDGVLRDWWTAEDAAKFTERAAVLGAQYAALSPIEGATVNGDLTMGENIADLGGLLLALDAYRMSLNGQPAPVLNGFTGEQRVFLGWAQVWRSNARDEYLRNQVTVDPHAPEQYRAGVTPRNIDAWYEAFGVQPGDEQYIAPEARARIW